jgi:predicted aconitase with swiveling domain
VLIDGEARGRLLRLGAPLSFWGGVDPDSGEITQPRHPEHRQCLRGRVLAMPPAIGSSSSSAVLLELLHNGHAPAALLLERADAILSLGVIVAREMGYGSIPVLHCAIDELPADASLHIAPGGIIEVESAPASAGR